MSCPEEYGRWIVQADTTGLALSALSPEDVPAPATVSIQISDSDAFPQYRTTQKLVARQWIPPCA